MVALNDTPSTIPGRLVVNPTDLSLAFPFGGTELGLAIKTTLDRPPRMSPDFVAEELGQAPYDALRHGEDWLATCTLCQWVDDTVSLVCPGWITGSGSIPRTPYPGAEVTPVSMAEQGVKLLFVAETIFGGADKAEVHAWIMYRAVPILTEPKEYRAFGDHLMAISWTGYPDDTVRFGDECSLQDVVL